MTKTYTPNVINQYTSAESAPVTIGSEHEIASYQGINYTYINDGRLSTVSNGTNSNTYFYDALGRCVKRVFSGSPFYYIYDGEKPILEQIASGWVAGWNVYGKGIDEILERGTGGADNIWHWYFYNQDHEGNVTHLTDTTGAVIEKYKYDAFGAPVIMNAAGAQIAGSFYNNPFLFTGRAYAGTYGFYEYRARAYHPRLGRFMSEDPKLFVHDVHAEKTGDDWSFEKDPAGAELNLFRYCGNDPLDFTDPMGLDTYEQNRQLLVSVLGIPVLTGQPLAKGDPVSHTFVFTTKPDGSVEHTYSWGNKANTRGWNRDQEEDLKAAKKQMSHPDKAIKKGDSKLDPYVEKAFNDLNKRQTEHDNGWFRNNCKTEAEKLLDTARDLQKKQFNEPTMKEGQ